MGTPISPRSIDLLSRHGRFQYYDDDQLTASVRLRLLRQTHVAAMLERWLVGYFGWLRTTAK